MEDRIGAVVVEEGFVGVFRGEAEAVRFLFIVCRRRFADAIRGGGGLRGRKFYQRVVVVGWLVNWSKFDGLVTVWDYARREMERPIQGAELTFPQGRNGCKVPSLFIETNIQGEKFYGLFFRVGTDERERKKTNHHHAMPPSVFFGFQPSRRASQQSRRVYQPFPLLPPFPSTVRSSHERSRLEVIELLASRYYELLNLKAYILGNLHPPHPPPPPQHCCQ